MSLHWAIFLDCLTVWRNSKKETSWEKTLHVPKKICKNLWQNKVCEQFLNKEMIKQFPPSTCTDPCSKHSVSNSSTQHDSRSESPSLMVKLGVHMSAFLSKYQTKKHSRKLTYPTLGKGKSSSQYCFCRGYVSSQEGTIHGDGYGLSQQPSSPW